MNRREILKFSGAAIFATAASYVVVRGRAVAGSAFADKEAVESLQRQRSTALIHEWGGDKLRAAQRIVNESGDRWLAFRDRSKGRNPVFITFNDGWVYEAYYKHYGKKLDHWWISWRRITPMEQAELTHYFAECSSKLCTQIGQPTWLGSKYKTRGFIKHGRYPRTRGWTHSVE